MFLRWQQSASIVLAMLLCTSVAAAQGKKISPDKVTESPSTKAPVKKAPPAKVVIQGVTYEVLMTNDDKVGSIAPRKLIKKWVEFDINNAKSGGTWTTSSFTWTVNLPKETPPVRVLVPVIVDGKVTVRVDDREEWSVDRKGLIAKGDVSPIVATPGKTEVGVQLVIQVQGFVSNVALLVLAKDAPATKKDDQPGNSDAKAAELLAKAKEALDAKNVALAKVRLKVIINEYGRTSQADEARAILKSLER